MNTKKINGEVLTMRGFKNSEKLVETPGIGDFFKSQSEGRKEDIIFGG
ncbi:MAG: hypothetical protein GTO45_35585 [Candidatus Aminicenantes bacterium]|nr:hypothetical protein [Candidatus Aminicenantes bacterium]NIM83999.1 hypothetical protein [Candidatus Aminicenantes bacterium]NIN23477.1 hypothetical protein [Candidatus Aminicenantes bacterium]NIN47182.1 hypothetical protein [Candidatus Aminicenantes bacterium]NIN90106.1 hypothetical protein [Candidatus Aminicenantes bacterium]